MVEFEFVVDRVSKQRGILKLEANSLCEALQMMHWGSGNFEPSNPSRIQFNYLEPSLYRVDGEMATLKEKY